MARADAASPPPPAAQPSPAAQRAWGRRLGRGLVWAVVAWLGVCLLVWLVLPGVAKRQIEQRGSEALGRPVQVAAVELQPWSLALALDGLQVDGLGGLGGAGAAATPLLRIDRLELNLHALSLWHGAPVVEALRLSRPQVHLARLSDGHYDIDDLLARFGAPSQGREGEPARFALHNLEVVNGSLVVDDQPKGQVHRLSGLQLTLPFLSNLPQHLAVTVQPRLAFELDGARFDTGAQATPFAPTRQARLQLAVPRLDLTPWLPYWPAALPLRPSAGFLQGQLSLAFDQPPSGPPELQISGQLSVQAVQWQDRQGQAMAAWQGLELGLRDVQPLRQRWHFDRVVWQAPSVKLVRDAKGRITLWPEAVPASAGPSTSAASGATAAVSPAAASGAGPAAQGTDESGPDVSVARFELTDAQIDWQDQQPRTPVNWQVQALGLAVDGLRWPLPPLAQPTRWRWQFALAGSHGASGRSAPASAALARFEGDGELNAEAGQARLSWDDLGLAGAAPYLEPLLVPRLTGQISGRGQWTWTGPPSAGQGQGLLEDLTVSNLMLAVPGAQGSVGGVPATGSRIGWKQLRLQQVRLDPQARRVQVGRLQWQQPDLQVQRGPDGQLDLLSWWRPAAPGSAAASTPAPTAPAWQLQLAQVELSDGRVGWRDEATGPRPVDVAARSLQLRTGPMQWPAGRQAAPTPVQGSLVWQDLQSGASSATPSDTGRGPARRVPGTLQWAGRLALEPLSWQGDVQADRLPVQALAAYALPEARVAVLRAEAGWRGRVAVARQTQGWQARLEGDARLGDLRVHARQAEAVADDELLSWQALALDGLRLTVQPGRPPELVVREAQLDDAFARLVVTEAGRLNLSDLAPPPPAASDAVPGTPLAPQPVAAPATVSAPAPAASAAPPPVLLEVGAVLVRHARVDFSDRFIRPNYRADLSELNGRLGSFATGRQEPTPLELKGRAAGTALLDIRGTLNPTASPLSLDLQARATDLELAPLSPYAGKYAGYAIERGKLSMDVSYRIQPDGRLDAKNQIVLNQLTFGERIDSPDATQLPVLLAVALLKDRHGVIDLDLPVSGSLQDPQFSMGGLIVKVIVNLLTKAITAPFALLAGGGGDELSHVEFLPGTARLAEPAAAVIDRVGRALLDRPALKMTVAGASDPQAEREAMQAAQLEARLLAEQRKEWLRNGGAAQAELPALTAAERARLLGLVYADTRLPDKPRNLIGLTKALPPADMEALLKAAVVVSPDTARELALQRGLVVRDALIARGVPAERLFLAAPRLHAPGDETGPWRPRVQLTLGTQ